MEVCLDTDVLIDFLRGNTETVKMIEKLEKDYELATTSINIFELYYGACKTRKEKNVKAVDDLSSSLEVYMLTDKSAKISGELIAELESRGEVIDFRDVLIAGMVIENGSSLLTGNVKHFRRIKGLKLFQKKAFSEIKE